MGRAILRLTPSEIIAAFHLPGDTKIIRCQQRMDKDVIDFVLEHESLPKQEDESFTLMEVYPLVEKAKFKGWGI